MIGALEFISPLALLGLLAVAIPPVLHLLAKSRASDRWFPTLRFIKLSANRTSRGRRIRHVGLMALRMAILGLMALAVSEPLSRPLGSWGARQGASAVIVLDNSMSMFARHNDGTTSFDRARREASKLLNMAAGERPAMSALVTTVPPDPGRAVLSDKLGELRNDIQQITPAFCAAREGWVRRAVELIKQSSGQRDIYVVTNLNHSTVDNLEELRSVDRVGDVNFMVIDTAPERMTNVGITNVQATGPRIADHPLRISAELTNHSDSPRTVEVAMRINGTRSGQARVASLAPAREDGATKVVAFERTFDKPGQVNIELVIETPDDLIEDNTRWLALDIGGRIEAMVVKGPPRNAPSRILEAHPVVQIALEPFGDDETPWHIKAKTIEASQLAADAIEDADIVFLCDVQSFEPAGAEALRNFVANGGWAVVFLGPSVDVRNYNSLLGDRQRLLPARIGDATGETGFDADAWVVEKVDVRHPVYEGLFPDARDYLGVIVQRYYPLDPLANAGVLMQLKNAGPLVVQGSHGRGRCVMVATDASALWSSLPKSSLFAPMLLRMSLLARQDTADADAHTLCGEKARITPKLSLQRGGEVEVVVAPPTLPGQTVAARMGSAGLVATFDQTREPGFYTWRARHENAEAFGSFAVNPDATQGDGRRVGADELVRGFNDLGIKQVHVANSVEQAHELARAHARPRNWWDLFCVAAVVGLVFETMVANLFRRTQKIPK